jgi:hypothetical protein
MNGLDAVATAIMAREGYRTNTRSFRNNNPGNLRGDDVGIPKDSEGFLIFPDVITGYERLWDDLFDKFTGHNDHGLGPASTVLDLFNVYAPSADGNDTDAYAAFVASWCSEALGKPITVSSALSEIFVPT